MRGHMKGVRRVRCNLGITLRRIQSLLSQNRIVVGMDDVVREPWMSGLLKEDRLENLGCFPLIRVSLVVVGGVRDQRQGVKGGRFAVLRIPAVQRLHRSLVPFGTDAVTF